MSPLKTLAERYQTALLKEISYSHYTIEERNTLKQALKWFNVILEEEQRQFESPEDAYDFTMLTSSR